MSHKSQTFIHAEQTGAAQTRAAQPRPANDATRRAFSFTPARDSSLQRQCACGGSSSFGGPCPACRNKKKAQPKLRINPPGDVYEREADRMAETVLSISPDQSAPATDAQAAGVQRATARDHETNEAIQPKPISKRITPFVQRQADDEENLTEETKESEEEEEEATEVVQEKSSGDAPEMTPEIESSIDALRGAGRPLGVDERDFFEPRFGYDFSRVRIHTGAQASETARSINARAFTVGHDIVFGASEYQPGGEAGRRMLAHELTHVIQQNPSNGSSLQLAPIAIQRVDCPPVTECPPVPETEPNPRALKKVVIYLNDKLIIATTHGGESFHLALVPKKTNIKVDNYEAVHALGQYCDCIRNQAGLHWGFTTDPNAPYIDYGAIPTSEYDLIVKGSSEIFEGGSQEGGKKSGAGGGEKDEGAGEEKSEGEGVEGEKEGAEGEKGEAGTGPSAEDQKIAADFFKSLEEEGIPTGGPPEQEVVDLLKEMTPAERDDFARFVRESKAKADEEGKQFDLKEVTEFYKNLSPSDRELLRTNLELSAAKAGATELPEKVILALETSAETTQKSGETVGELNKQLGELARIHKKVVVDGEEVSTEPFDVNELPIFTEMMMLEGLLAGASAKSPEIETLAKELTTSIGAIRSYILEEITWLATEMAITSIASYLIAPASGGLSIVISGTRAAFILKRLNDLRKFLEKVEGIYNTVTTIRGIIAKVLSASEKYNEFKTQYDEWMRKLETLETKLEKADVDALTAGSTDLDEEIERVEELLLDELQKQLDNEQGLGGLLEFLFIPQGATEEDLKEILFNIPRGVEAFRELVAFYDSVNRSDLEEIKTLAFKATRAGALLYPFVGYLAMSVSNQLGALMSEKTVGDRLLEIITSAAKGHKRHHLPDKKATRAKFKEVKKRKEKKKENEEKEKKQEEKEKKKKRKEKDQAQDQGGKKKKGEQEKEAEKKKGEGEKKKGEEMKKDAEKKEEEETDPKKIAEKEAKKKDDDEWQEVKRKVARLPGAYASEGVTQEDLLSAARVISKAHKTVAGGPRVIEATGKGYWVVTIERKGSTEQAREDVLMSTRTRWIKGREAIEARLSRLTAAEVDKASVERIIEPYKHPYGYSSLIVKNRTDRKQGLAVNGKMDKAKEGEVATIDDVTDLHYGTETDPIPVHWYKHEGNYPKKIKLNMDGVSREYSMGSEEHLELITTEGTIRVRVGVDMSYLIKKYPEDTTQSLLRRRSTPRSTTKQRDFREVLKRWGYDWTGKDADHVKDLGFEGKDDFDNLWPLDSRVNRWAYSGKWYTGYGIEYRDTANPLRSNTGTLYTLRDKYFRVIGFETTPRKLGGKTDLWKSPDKP